MGKMHAVRVHQFGGPEVLHYEEIAIPECGAGEVLVRVHAAGVGPWDDWVRSGKSVVPQPLPLTPGSDVAGEIVAVGENVVGLVPGDVIFGATNSRFTNGYADFALCEASMLAPKPKSLGYVEAASVPVIAATAWQMLFCHAKLRPGETVLVHGAGGNVGAYAVQLARQAGARVLATASERDQERLTMLGANGFVDRSLLAPAAVDIVIDLVGGEQQPRLFDFLGAGGRLISAVAEPDKIEAMERGIRSAFILVAVDRLTLERIARLFDQKTLVPWVGAVMPLSQASLAHEAMAGLRSDRPRGKIVLQPDGVS